MNKIEDGGPAFPADNFAAQYCPGMSLRDWFAGQALAGLIEPFITASKDSVSLAATADGYSGNMAGYVAMKAYWFADAMLAVRAKATQEPTR